MSPTGVSDGGGSTCYGRAYQRTVGALWLSPLGGGLCNIGENNL